MANILIGFTPHYCLHTCLCVYLGWLFKNTVADTDPDGGVQWKLLVLGHYTTKLGCHT